MDLNFNNKLEEYYRMFIELQEKLKRSEEQRFMLEMKFNEMVQVAKEEEQSYYRKLRAQYKKFLEEDQKRHDRNEHIIRNLERIEAKIAMLSAKTERISTFRRQYQKYLRRIVNSKPDKETTISRLSRERSFIKEEPLKERQQAMFRDDYSLPDMPKETFTDKDKEIYQHPAVKKSFEKDRSNEEKIEILDRYLQNISSQRCRDLVNQEQPATDKLCLDTPLDKLFKDDFLSTSTNHATAVADDIMNSIYSRYYAKAEVPPKSNKTDLPTNIQNNDEKSDSVKKEFSSNDKSYFDRFLNKNAESVVDKRKLNTDSEKEERITQLEDKPKSNIRENNPERNQYLSNAANGFLNKFESNKEFYSQEQNNIPNNAASKHDISKSIPSNDNKNDIANKMTKDMKIDYEKDQENMENQIKDGTANKTARELNDLPKKNELKYISTINQPHFEESKAELHDNSEVLQNFIPKSMPNKEIDQQNIIKGHKLEKEDQIKYEPQDQITKYDFSNPINQNKDNLPETDQTKLKSQEESLEFLQGKESCYPEGKSETEQFNQQNENEQYGQDDNQIENSPVKPEISQRYHDNPNEPSIEYDQNDESEQQALIYNQSQDITQPIQFNSADEYSVQPGQLAQIEQPTEFAENDPSYQQIQYDATGQPTPYDGNGQLTGYDQYGQPLMYDQNGQVVQPQYDENGQFIPQYDENGQMVVLYDQNGQLLFNEQYKDNQEHYDLNGQPMQYDENGQPIYDPNQQQYYDYTNQDQTDPSNGYSQFQGDNQVPYTETPESHPQNQTEEAKYFQDGDQGPYPDVESSQLENDQFQPDIAEMQNITDEKEHNKPSNVMDILDTDTESAKQTVSKVSNESDFDFS